MTSFLFWLVLVSICRLESDELTGAMLSELLLAGESESRQVRHPFCAGQSLREIFLFFLYATYETLVTARTM
jgi:hypothetical protein